jgi:hypothetical protein
MKSFTRDEQALDQDIQTEEMTRDELLMGEEDILAGVLAAVESKEKDFETLVIKRGDKVFFKFRISALGDDEVKNIREKNSIYKKVNGVRILEDFNDVRFRSEIIFKATIAEDRDKIWNNPKIKEQLHLLSPTDVIDKVLMAGEKDAIYDRVQKFSGFGKDEEMVETLKN